MNDKQLLELAARAVGLVLDWHQEMSGDFPVYRVPGGFVEWNPLLQDADAFQLAAALPLNVNFSKGCTTVYGHFTDRDFLTSPCPRRAIVLAAANLGASA